jgi:hypothetical protein
MPCTCPVVLTVLASRTDDPRFESLLGYEVLGIHTAPTIGTIELGIGTEIPFKELTYIYLHTYICMYCFGVMDTHDLLK